MIPGIQGLVHICLGVIRHAYCSCSIADSDLYLLVHTSHSLTEKKKTFFPHSDKVLSYSSCDGACVTLPFDVKCQDV